MKKTALNAVHRELGGHMIEFAGYELPVQYTSIIEEHRTVRAKVGLFDLTHMGEFWFEGPGALEFANRLVTNDVAAARDGQVLYTPMCYPDGGIVDDLLAYRFSGEKILLVVNGACVEKDWEWVAGHAPSGLKVTNASDETSLIAVQGPLAEEAVRSVSDIPLEPIGFYEFAVGRVAGVDGLLLSRTGYTGEDGFEIYMPNAQAETVWRALWPGVEELGGRPIGLGARDTLRLEMKYCLYGNDIDKTTNPLEAGLAWTVKLEKEDFIGRDALVKVKEAKPARRLVCFEMLGRGIARQHAKCYDGEEEIGEVTSGTMSPSLGKAVGLAYLASGHHKPDTEFDVDLRGELRRAVVVKPPFYKQGTRK
ncbi:MAG TPA: glycine cleavage system aminomethyltransferase GcvT [Candidatus Coatesbacteria bacterium]|nr:glycine cleavage system aminomethyltransferase GcvT [Candidatus Coatesbacteria bacterium]